MSKSQLYHYFADKDALTHEIIRTQSERNLAAQMPLIDEIKSITDFRHWANTFLDIYISAGGTGGCPLGSLASELAARSEPARELLMAGFREWTSRLARGFEKMQMSGELDSACHPDELSEAVFAALQGGLLLTKTFKNPAPLKAALKMAIKYVESYRSPNSYEAEY